MGVTPDSETERRQAPTAMRLVCSSFCSERLDLRRCRLIEGVESAAHAYQWRSRLASLTRTRRQSEESRNTRYSNQLNSTRSEGFGRLRRKLCLASTTLCV